MKPSSDRAPRNAEKSPARSAGNAENDTNNVNYESGLTPLLWLAIPFVLVLLYGILT